ncbi:MAG TPA: gas vesicle protein K [Thermoanaerobaculia bacterium]
MSQREEIALQIQELEDLRAEIERQAASQAPHWNADPEEVQRSVARLVLALVEFLRKLMERQAIRRMEAGTLAPEEIENLGLALMKLEETLHDIARRFGLNPEDLNLDLGPLGKLI